MPAMLVLTSDACTFTVPDQVVEACGTLKTACDARIASEDVVPVPNVSSACMTRIVEYYTKLADLHCLGAPATSIVSYKTRFFQRLSRPELYATMEALNFLDGTTMMNDSCMYVAELIRGCSPNDLREIFMLPSDMTSDEAREMADHLAWALK